ncbi:MAG: beta-ketoacyl-[acyl-carrier-protein] synthase family protein [Planctomycetaceae bacterium]|nr:beta-ketoacyl-[acyl-carrier-protein] synthase family protein [Planctomycetaceae bacterium]
MGDERRTVITGMGLISPLGNTPEALWEALSTGRSGVGPLSFDAERTMPVHFGAEARHFTGGIDDFGPLEKEQKKAIRKALKMMCRECQIGVAAALLALNHAGLKPGATDPERSGISFGTDYMLSAPEDFSEAIAKCRDGDGQFDFPRWGAEGISKMEPLWLLKYLPNMPASHLAIYTDFRGPNNSLTMREAAANAAIGEAHEIISRGHAEIMLVGATGTRLHSMKMGHTAGQEEIAAGDSDPAAMSRPFDRSRCGEVLGEGAGAIVLEELSAALARGATIYGEVVGAATSCVADCHLLARRDRALQNVFQAALNAAKTKPDQVGHVHAHGLSTRTCDVDESRAIQAICGDRPVPVVAAKSYFGNLGAGSGMVELMSSLLAMQHGRLFPILNYATPDPECPVAAVRDSATAPGDSFVNLSVTPQAQAAAVMVRRYGG